MASPILSPHTIPDEEAPNRKGIERTINSLWDVVGKPSLTADKHAPAFEFKDKDTYPKTGIDVAKLYEGTDVQHCKDKAINAQFPESVPPFTSSEIDDGNKKIVQLRDCLLRCDEVLKAIESSLSDFQEDLGKVSTEIESLQSRSYTINTKLHHRRALESLLGPTIEDLVISPKAIVKITDGTIDHEWLATLQTLDQRLSASSLTLFSEQSSFTDLRPLLENVKSVAIERIREYLVSQIRLLRLPNSNAQLIQQHNLLPYREAFDFLFKYHHRLAEDLIQAYLSTMRWYYSSGFGRYKEVLEKMMFQVMYRQDALAADFTSSKVTNFGSANSSKLPNTWSLGHRASVLDPTNSSALSAYLALDMRTAAYIETIFHAFSTALMDNASVEYSFLASFFPKSTSAPFLSQIFSGIFTSTFELGHELTRKIIGESIDCVGLLLCIRIMEQHAFVLQRRQCPVAESWVNNTKMLLWPRFQAAMDSHVDSVRHASDSTSSSTRTTLLLTAIQAETSKVSVAPHPICQRLGQLLQAITALTRSDMIIGDSRSLLPSENNPFIGCDVEPVARSLQRLRNQVQAFLEKISKGMATDRRKRFLCNNYNLVLTIIGEPKGVVASEQHEWLKARLEEVEGI